MATGMMSSRNSWCMLAIRGIIALLFGLAVFIRPNIFNSFGFLFGIYALIDGIMVAGMAMGDHDRHGRWWVMLLGSLVGIVFGLLAMFTTMSLLYVIAFWAFIMGILELASVFAMQRNFRHDWTMVIAGIASVVLGIVFFFSASKSVLSLLWLVGIFAIVFGVMMFSRFVQVKSAMDMSAPTATA